MQARSALRARVAVLFLATAVASCGGGGDGSSAPLPPPPPPALIPAVTSVPEPVGYSAAKLAAFHRLNELRAQAGLGLLAQNTSLDAAAQAHADWEVFNNLYTHIETEGTPKFSGVYPTERDLAFGYPQGGFNDEVLSAGFDSAAAIDGLVQVIYHRQAVLAHQLRDIGIGWSENPIPSFGRPLAVDMATRGGFDADGEAQAPRSEMSGIVVWPSSNASNVWCAMGGEYPNPMPGYDMYSVGTPITVEVEYWRKLAISAFWLKDVSTGETISSVLLTFETDPNQLIQPNFAGIIPFSALVHNRQYAVHVEGSIDGSAFAKDWRFTTGAGDVPPPN